MLPNKKIIAFDVDGTLTASKSPITEDMVFLLKELIKQKTVIAMSGAKFGQFETQFLPLFLNDNSFASFLPNLIIISTSGTQRYEYDIIKKEYIQTFKEPLDENVKKRIKELLQKVIDSNLYDIPQNIAGDIVEDRDTQITFSACGQLASIEIKKAWDPDQKKRKRIVADLERELPEVTMLINAYSSIDIVPKGFNKAVGLMQFINKLNLEKSDVIFVGDGLFPGGNDYSVKEAGFDTMPVTGPEETALIIKEWLG
ncbi:MAG: HAD-IIB family hydrolase [Candidatus Paceibacterota bacterium]